MFRVLFLLPLGACVPSEVLCVDDFDNDGICGAEDPCPVDPGNDDDGDGICAADDICDLGDDRVDADFDGTPDACDVCPDDALDDVDNDGVCGKLDPCPDVPGTVCDRTFVVGLQVDRHPSESTYEITTSSGSALASGSFTEAGEIVFSEYEVSTGEESLCVRMTDSYPDGGVSGFIWDKAKGELMHRWTYYDWLNEGSYCADVTPGIPEEAPAVPYDETTWSTASACEVTIEVVVLNYGSEIGWTLFTGSLREIEAVSPNTYGDFTTNEHHLTVYEGRHVFRMTDTFADGWDGTTFKIKLKDSDAVPFSSGTLIEGSQQDLEVVIDCPDSFELPVEDDASDSGL
jgi:hypothetical protein